MTLPPPALKNESSHERSSAGRLRLGEHQRKSGSEHSGRALFVVLENPTKRFDADDSLARRQRLIDRGPLTTERLVADADPWCGLVEERQNPKN
jgi:hypothetical protein